MALAAQKIQRDNRMKKINFGGTAVGYILALAIVCVWGTTFVSTKYLLNYLVPVEIMLYRVTAAYAAFLILYPHPLPKVGWRTEAKIACAGFLGLTLYFLCENSAMIYSTSSNVAMLCATSPLLTGFIAHIFTKNEKISRRFLIGSLLCLVGIFFIIGNGRFILKLNPLGDVIALGAALSFACYSVLIRNVECVYTPAQVARTMLFYTMISLMLLALTPFVKLHTYELLRPAVLGNVIFLSLCASVFCTWGWNIVIWRLGAVKANNLIYLIPPVTMLFSAIILDERITIFAITGNVLILAGVFISQKIKSRP